MNNKPFWQDKTCKEMAGLHVKVTFKDGSILTGKTNPDADIVVNYLTVRLSCRAGDDPFLPIRGIDTIELLDNPEYERIDNIEDVCEGDVRDSDFIRNGESFYCPQCGRHLKAATGTVKGSEEKRYRFGVRVHRPFRAVGNHAGLFWFSIYRFSVSNGAPPAVPA